MEILNNSEIIERMKIAANIKEDKELAVLLSVPKSTLANWKRASDFPLKNAVIFCERFGCDLTWLITGKDKERKLDTSERMLLTAFADLDDTQKMQAVLFLGNLANGNKTMPTSASAGVLSGNSQISGGDATSYNVTGDFIFNKK
ncbi:helix-turn-helix domain containing protein [Mannheimia haemolytica]